MKQAVRKFQYVATPKFSSFDFPKAQSLVACILPDNAAVLSVAIVVNTPAQAGATLDVGLNSTQDFFLNDIKLSEKGTKISSEKVITNGRSEITILPSAALTQGDFSVIVEFALSTTYDYEV